MKNFLTEIQKDYPWSDFNKYWDYYEFLLRKNPWEWCFKISWLQDQVKRTTLLIIWKYYAHKLKS